MVSSNTVRLGVLSLLIVLAISLTIQTAWAAPNQARPNQFISVIRSETCERTNCITLKELIPLDNSTQKISGKFIKSGDDYIRGKGMKNAHEYYKIFSGNLFVFVEPDQTTLSKSKVITISKTLPYYALKKFEIKSEVDFHTDKRQIQHSIYVDEKCNKATVSANMGNITAAINHLASNCQTDLNNTDTITTKKAPRDYCGQECQHQKWMKQALKESKTKVLRK